MIRGLRVCPDWVVVCDPLHQAGEPDSHPTHRGVSQLQASLTSNQYLADVVYVYIFRSLLEHPLDYIGSQYNCACCRLSGVLVERLSHQLVYPFENGSRLGLSRGGQKFRLFSVPGRSERDKTGFSINTRHSWGVVGRCRGLDYAFERQI